MVLGYHIITRVPPLLHTPLMLFGDAKEGLNHLFAALKA